MFIINFSLLICFVYHIIRLITSLDLSNAIHIIEIIVLSISVILAYISIKKTIEIAKKSKQPYIIPRILYNPFVVQTDVKGRQIFHLDFEMLNGGDSPAINIHVISSFAEYEKGVIDLTSKSGHCYTDNYFPSICSEDTDNHLILNKIIDKIPFKELYLHMNIIYTNPARQGFLIMAIYRIRPDYNNKKLLRIKQIHDTSIKPLDDNNTKKRYDLIGKTWKNN